ncbi:MAG: DMT family transporter [Rhodospirillaceae bacterium]
MLTDFLTDRVSVRAALWMSVASLLVALSAACVRELSENYSIFQLVFLRNLIGTTLLSPWIIKMGRGGSLKTSRLKLYMLRTVLSYSGMVCVFYGFANMPLGEVYTLLFLVPLITVLLAVIILGEKAGRQAWLACGLGFIGAMVVLRPGIISISLAAGAVLYTAASYAAVNICIKYISKTDTPVQITVYGHGLALPVALLPALVVWKTPTWEDLPWILALAALQLLSALSHARAVSAADARVVQPFNFLRLPFSVLIAWLLFSELPSEWTWLGAILIFAGSYYTIYSENRQKQRPKNIET